jgi:uncharacterized protein YndB with AHSA1/START domain
MWYMKPVRVSVDTDRRREEVYDFLDVMANHRSFNDHFLAGWECSGPERGVGSRARVRTKGPGSDMVDIEVVSARAPETIVEQSVGAKGRRLGTGTYTLEERPGGGTRVVFEYAWQRAPLSERIAAPLTRAIVRRGTGRALRRLADELSRRVEDPA